jgi:hypothetical protein
LLRNTTVGTVSMWWWYWWWYLLHRPSLHTSTWGDQIPGSPGYHCLRVREEGMYRSLLGGIFGEGDTAASTNVHCIFPNKRCEASDRRAKERASEPTTWSSCSGQMIHHYSPALLTSLCLRVCLSRSVLPEPTQPQPARCWDPGGRGRRRSGRRR